MFFKNISLNLNTTNYKGIKISFTKRLKQLSKNFVNKIRFQLSMTAITTKLSVYAKRNKINYAKATIKENLNMIFMMR